VSPLAFFSQPNLLFREKARIPAWTDRILRKGGNLRQLAYNSAPLRFSDHRPVYSIFECTVSIVDERLRDKISREIYERRKVDVGGDTANLAAGLEESEDEDLIGYDAIEPGLPPASSDRQKWWLENGRMARSNIVPPKPENPAYQTILNPKRPANPYAPTDEQDWVNIPRSESRLSSFSSMSTSPYEHVNHSMLLASTASSTAPRKLPPAYDPSTLPAKVGRMQINEESAAGQTEGAPPPPPPRRQTGSGNGTPAAIATYQQPRKRPVPSPAPSGSSVSVVSQQSSKPKGPPPVAKKPAHLAAPASPASSTSSTFVSETAAQQDQVRVQLPGLARRSTALVKTSTPSHGSIPTPASGNGIADTENNTPPQLPRRAVSSASVVKAGRGTPAGAVGLVGLADQERRPQSAAQKPLMVQKPPAPAPPAPRRSQAVDLLGDDGGSEIGGWEALKPS
jgi:synaptojanin